MKGVEQKSEEWTQHFVAGFGGEDEDDDGDGDGDGDGNALGGGTRTLMDSTEFFL